MMSAIVLLTLVGISLSGCVLIPPSPAEVSIRKVVDDLRKADVGRILCHHEQRDFSPLSTVPYQNSVLIEDQDNATKVVDYLKDHGFTIRDDLVGDYYRTLIGPNGIRATVASLTRERFGKSVDIGGGQKCAVPYQGVVDVYLLPQ